MSQKRSRVVRYAELRKKIESTTYQGESMGTKSAPSDSFGKDDERRKREVKTSPKVIHNTLSIPLSELLNQDGRHMSRRAMMSTQEFKALDTSPEQKKRKNGSLVNSSPRQINNIFRKWWAWALVGIVVLAVVGLIVYFSLRY